MKSKILLVLPILFVVSILLVLSFYSGYSSAYYERNNFGNRYTRGGGTGISVSYSSYKVSYGNYHRRSRYTSGTVRRYQRNYW